MPARVAKYPPIVGVGMDYHSVAPPSVPPPPPAPPNPAIIPVYPWIVQVSTQIAGFALTGKWSWHRVTVEGVGNILWGHDWGMGQAHVPVPPVLASPSIVMRVLGSSTKYWLPTFSVREPVDGSVPGGDTPMAVSTPAWVTSTQNCQDISGWPFVAPTTFCFQMVSSKHVAFTFADLGAGAIGMAGDAVGALVGRAIGGAPKMQDVIAGAAAGALIGQLMARLPPPPGGTSLWQGLLGGAAMLGLGDAGGGTGNAVAALVAPFISQGAGSASNRVASGPTYQRGLDGPTVDSRTGRPVSED